MATIETSNNANVLRTGLELTADGIAGLLGDPNDINVIEARKVSAFVIGMRSDPSHAAVLTGGKAKKGELHPVVAALVRKGYEESSAKQYRSKMLAIRSAYIAAGFIPADGTTWNGAYEQARKVNMDARLNNAVHRARAEAAAKLPKGTDGESIVAAMEVAENEVREQGGQRRKQTIEAFTVSIIKRCETDGYDLAEVIERLQAVQQAITIGPVGVQAPAEKPKQAERVH